MSELSHALAALEGKAEQQAPTPASPEAAAKFRVPRHLLRQPHLRAVALSCHEAAEAASHSPEDFGGVYRQDVPSLLVLRWLLLLLLLLLGMDR